LDSKCDISIYSCKIYNIPCSWLIIGNKLSCSCSHINYDKWWNQQESLYNNLNIDKTNFKDFKFKNGFNKGDIMVLISAKKINIGDAIVFNGQATEPIIHRVIIINEDGTYQTKGDNNSGSREDEKRISKDKIIGKAVLKIPYLGWIKLGFINLINLIMGKA